MAHITLIARINDGSGKFPFVKVEFSKNHRPIAIEGGTYYLRPSSGNRTPVHVGKDIDVAYAALLNSELGKIVVPGIQAERSAEATARKTVRQAADGYIEQSRGLEHKTYLSYRAAANLFLLFCQKTYLDEIRRDDMVNFETFLRTHVSAYTDEVFEPSTVFNYFLKVMVFLNDVGIAKYVPDKEWVRMKDWPPNVDKKNKNKKYAVYTEAEFASLLSVTNLSEEALLRFLAGTGYRIGEAAIAQWGDIDWKAKTISVLFKPQFKFKPPPRGRRHRDPEG